MRPSLYDISSAQLNCLLTLQETGPLPPSQIAKSILDEPRELKIPEDIDREIRKKFKILLK